MNDADAGEIKRLLGEVLAELRWWRERQERLSLARHRDQLPVAALGKNVEIAPVSPVPLNPAAAGPQAAPSRRAP